jgi:hypothetical protein
VLIEVCPAIPDKLAAARHFSFAALQWLLARFQQHCYLVCFPTQTD